MADATAGPKATRREWIGLAVLALPCLLYSMDLTVLNLAVPNLSADLRPTSAQLLWIIDIYGFVLAGALIPMGVLGDRIGRRKLLLIGAGFFGGASILAAFAHSVPLLIAARACLGLAAATLAPSTLSLIRNMFLDPKQRTVAIGVWISSFSVGGAIGPVLGGILLEYYWWGSVFLLNVPIMILLLAIGPRLLPESRDPDAGKPDLLSALLSLATVLSIIYGIKSLAQDGLHAETTASGLPAWIPAVAAIVAGLAVGVVFVRRQQHLTRPFVDIALFHNRAFSTAIGINIASVFAAFGSFLFVAQYLQLVIGLTPLEAGLYSAPSGLAFIAGSTLTPHILKRVRPAYVMASGLTLTGLSFALLAQVSGGVGDLAIVVTTFVLFSLGLSTVFTLTTDLIIGAVPPERAGVAAGMAETSTEFGGALGIALLGSMVTAIYRYRITHDMTTVAGIPADGFNAIRDTLGGALAVAADLPMAVSEQLTHLARAAYVEAFQVVALTCAALVIVAAIASAHGLRQVHRPH